MGLTSSSFPHASEGMAGRIEMKMYIKR